jgi:hypothetical protein
MAQKTFADKAYVNTELAKKANKEHGTHLTLGTGSGNAYRGDYGNTAYNHSQAAHAPSNAQKNSDITKAEIEAKLTGTITTHKHTLLESNDTRSKNELPSTYTNRGIVPEFKSSATIGLPEVGKGFTGLITYQQWSDTSAWSGGKATQFGTIDDGRMYYRKGDGSGWGTWYQFYTTQNKPTPADIGAAVANHGNHVPTPQAAQNTTFLRNDNTWYKLTRADLGAAAESHGTHVTYGTTNPLVAGTASPGSAATVSRSDHIHPAQTSVSGNAGTATTLKTARNIVIGNKTNSFNGSANITYTLSDIGATETVAWDTSIKCATWSRLFQFASSNPTTGGTFLVNIRATRSSVVYNPTLLVNFSHSSVCNIVQINNTSYSNIKVRCVVDTNGAGYFEIYDNVNSATNSTTQSVSVTVTEISSGLTITKYTAFTNGTTIPTNYASKGEITTVSGAYYSGTAAKADTATSASSATKATQDSAGQQINTTYIKGLSVSGRTITYTKGDGTTGTITTQDTNTTYSTGTASALGLTKLYTGTGTATDGTMTQAAIKTALDGKAASSHGNHFLDKTITTSFDTTFRTSTKGNSSAGTYFTVVRTDTASVSYAPQYGSGIAWGKGDTHGYLNVNYSTGLAYIGGGSGDKLNWAKQLAFTDSSITGNAATATKLATTRTITVNGVVKGSVSFDGSSNVTLTTSANDITTITKSLKVTTSWMDTGITGTNLATGTYAVQMLVNDGTNTSQWNEHYSGIMSWFADSTNSTDADEILLHKAGHASNGKHVFLRTIRTTNNGYLKLQICSSSAFAAASSITFKFKKLI